MNTRFVRRCGVLLLAVALTAASLPSDKPEAVGLSSERLLRINQMIQRYIDDGQITGAITMVSRRGKVAHFEAQGQMDLEKKTPMRKDAIFRIASMSKPITGVAILMLMEEGKLRLTDPVSRFIPEFKDSKVAIVKTPAAPATARTAGTRGGDLHGARRTRHHDPRSDDAYVGTRKRRRGHTARARGWRRAAPRARSRSTCRRSARCRSISSRARSGDTARWLALKRSDASSRSRPA